MKKLLLIGAMLIVGATSFSAVTEVLTPGGTGTQYSGTGRLPIESEGSILDPTGRVVLVLSAVDTAGTDGEALTFNFGAVGRGRQEVLAGRFQAKVLNGLKAPGTPAEEVSLKEATIDVKLERGGTKAIAHKFTVNKTGSTTEKLVDLTYELSKANGLSVDGKTYNGEVIATAFRPTKAVDVDGNYKSGEFIDNSVSLVFDISGLRVD